MKYATTGTYVFTRELADSIGKAMSRMDCVHSSIALLNDPLPALVCEKCNQHWLLHTREYGVPLVVALERCGSCDQPVDLANVACALHELRAAARECVVTQDDNRLGRAALRFTADVLRHMPLALSKITAEILLASIRLLDKMSNPD